MKAIVVSHYGEPDVLEYKEIAEPIPEKNEVKVRLFSAGVNPAETYITTGNYGFYKPDLPFTPGFDGAGIIDSLGEGVTHLQEGDRVYISGLLAQRNTGTYAQKVVCDASVVHPLPQNIGYSEGASLGIPSLTAYRSLFQRAKVRPGERVLIHGASGGVGILAVQMAVAFGAKVIGTASTPEGRQMILDAGADYAINHVKQEDIARIIDLTEGNGPDIIIEMLANVNLEVDLQMLAKYGRIIVVGNRGSIDFNPRSVMTKEADIKGMAIWNFTDEEYKESLAAIQAFLKAGLINPIVGDKLPLSEASKAQFGIINKKSKGKMVLEIE